MDMSANALSVRGFLTQHFPWRHDIPQRNEERSWTKSTKKKQTRKFSQKKKVCPNSKIRHTSLCNIHKISIFSGLNNPSPSLNWTPTLKGEKNLDEILLFFTSFIPPPCCPLKEMIRAYQSLLLFSPLHILELLMNLTI